MKSTMKTMALSLTALTALSAAILSGVRLLSEPKATDARAMQRRQALERVLPPFENIVTDSIPGTATFYRATGSDGAIAGIAVEATSQEGFGGPVTVLFGFDPQGRVHGYNVLSHKETPGLGSNMGTWFSAEGTAHNIIGSDTELRVSKDGGTIDAITGATITSRAFVQALNTARRIAEEEL